MSDPFKPRKIAVSEIRVDASVQSRVAMDAATIESYADAMQAGAKFPPVEVFGYTVDKRLHVYVLADGFHRVEAAQRAGAESIMAIVHVGLNEDDARARAMTHAAGANLRHGLRRTNADKRRAVELVLRVNWKWTDNRIAKHCGVHHDLVKTVRGSLAESASDDGRREVVTKHGTTTMMDTRRIGTAAKAKAIEVEAAGEQQTAAAGISEAMAKLKEVLAAREETRRMEERAARELPWRQFLHNVEGIVDEAERLHAEGNIDNRYDGWREQFARELVRLKAAADKLLPVSVLDDLDRQYHEHRTEVATLREAAKQKIDRLRDRELKLLRQHWDAQVREEARKQLPEQVEALRKAEAKAHAEFKKHTAALKGIPAQMSEADYRFLLGLLHPDRAPEDRRDKFAQGFDIVRKLDKYIEAFKA